MPPLVVKGHHIIVPLSELGYESMDQIWFQHVKALLRCKPFSQIIAPPEVKGCHICCLLSRCGHKSNIAKNEFMGCAVQKLRSWMRLQLWPIGGARALD